jgi:hypothetical protein
MSAIQELKLKIIEKILSTNNESILKRILQTIKSLSRFNITITHSNPIISNEEDEIEDLIDLSIP